MTPVASLLGIITILVAAWLLSTDRKNIPLKGSLSGFLTPQISFALLVLYVPAMGESVECSPGCGIWLTINYGQEGINSCWWPYEQRFRFSRLMFWASLPLFLCAYLWFCTTSVLCQK
ncbi:hypothetical protein OK016_03900 [Vibrio chagasii]|nr:hypothetical protein [Vibrio chagasii]